MTVQEFNIIYNKYCLFKAKCIHKSIQAQSFGAARFVALPIDELKFHILNVVFIKNKRNGINNPLVTDFSCNENFDTFISKIKAETK